MKQQRRLVVIGALIGVVVFATVPTAEAQQDFRPLFDTFNFKLGTSWASMKTQIGLDSESLGEGTTLNFESDLGLPDTEAIPSVSFEWQIARNHRLAVRWQEINRGSSAQALEEIQWGDETIPIDASIILAFDVSQLFVDYTYYPWVKDDWAVGFGLGLRMMDMYVTLQWEEEIIGSGGDEIDGTAPLPYLYFEYRRLFSDRWRFVTGLGWLYVEIGDVEGGQWIGRASMEYLLGDRWSFGGGINLSSVDVDWFDLEDKDGNPELTGHIDLDIHDFTFFVRVRF